MFLKAVQGLVGGNRFGIEEALWIPSGRCYDKLKFGRERSNFADLKKRFAVYRLVERLYNRFVKEYGSAYCYDIHNKMIFGGIAYNLRTEKRFKRFLEDGGHRDRCSTLLEKVLSGRLR